MNSLTRSRVSMGIALGILGASLAAGCGHNDAGTAGSATAIKAPAMPSGMPAEARQQTLQAEGAASPAALAAEHNAALRKTKP